MAGDGDSLSSVLTWREKEERRKEGDDDGVPAGGDRERGESSSQLGRLTLSGRAGSVAHHGGNEAAGWLGRLGRGLGRPAGAGARPDGLESIHGLWSQVGFSLIGLALLCYVFFISSYTMIPTCIHMCCLHM